MIKRAQDASRGVVLLIASLVVTDATAAVYCKQVDTETSSGARYAASDEQLRDGATHAELSLAVYECQDACKAFVGRRGDWEVLLDSRTWYRTRNPEMKEMLRRAIPNYKEPAIQPLDPSGFHGAAFQPADNSALIIAFEGTSSLLATQDWATNIGMAFWKPQQFADAEQFTLAVLDRHCGGDANCRSKVTVTGHSLGGALAQHVGLKYGLRTFTFNAAGLFPPTKEELAETGKLGFAGLHFFSQGYLFGAKYGADVVPFLGSQFAQDTCEVPIKLPMLAWLSGVTVEMLTHSIAGLSEAIRNEYDNRCQAGVLSVAAGKAVCGIGLSAAGDLTVDGKVVVGSREAMTGYITGRSGSRPLPATGVRVSMASPDGRYRLVSPSSDSFELGVELVLNVPDRTFTKVEMGRYGSSVVAWSAENLAVVEAGADGFDGLWILDAAAGRAEPLFREGLGFFQPEKTRWTDGRTLIIPNLPCNRFDFDHNKCWDAAVRQGFPVWTVRLEQNGRVTERLLSESPGAARQTVRVADIKDAAKIGGCGCTFNPVPGDGRVAWDRFTFFADFECNAWMNLDGQDVALRAAGWASTGVIGEGEECPPRASIYLGSGYGVRVKWVETKRCPPEPTECEVTEYDAVISVEREDRRTVVQTTGQCGC